MTDLPSDQTDAETTEARSAWPLLAAVAAGAAGVSGAAGFVLGGAAIGGLAFGSASIQAAAGLLAGGWLLGRMDGEVEARNVPGWWFAASGIRAIVLIGASLGLILGAGLDRAGASAVLLAALATYLPLHLVEAHLVRDRLGTTGPGADAAGSAGARSTSSATPSEATS